MIFELTALISSLSILSGVMSNEITSLYAVGTSTMLTNRLSSE